MPRPSLCTCVMMMMMMILSASIQGGAPGEAPSGEAPAGEEPSGEEPSSEASVTDADDSEAMEISEPEGKVTIMKVYVLMTFLSGQNAECGEGVTDVGRMGRPARDVLSNTPVPFS